KLRIGARDHRRNGAQERRRLGRAARVEREVADDAVLAIREHVDRTRMIAYAAVLGVLHQPNDLYVQCVAAVLAHVLADRVVAKTELLRELLVHDRHRWRARDVRRGEFTAGNEGNAHGMEVPGPDLVEI